MEKIIYLINLVIAVLFIIWDRSTLGSWDKLETYSSIIISVVSLNFILGIVMFFLKRNKIGIACFVGFFIFLSALYLNTIFLSSTKPSPYFDKTHYTSKDWEERLKTPDDYYYLGYAYLREGKIDKAKEQVSVLSDFGQSELSDKLNELILISVRSKE